MRSCGFLHDIRNKNITDETCAPYVALSRAEGRKCLPESICKECAPRGGCFVPKEYNHYTIGEYALVNTTANMMNEIYARGPIACGVNAIPIENFHGSGVFASDSTGGIDHIVSVVGWGEEEDGTPYWIMRNSWGEYWGDQGWAKIYRGNNTIKIEESCAYAIPIDTWSGQIYPTHLTEKVKAIHVNKVEEIKPKLVQVEDMVEEIMEKIYAPNRKAPKGGLKWTTDPDSTDPLEVVTSPRPEDYIELSSIPDSFWWGDRNGINYHSWTINQHVPQYCGSCWAQAAISALADRVRISTNNTYPKVAFSVQQIINCHGGGSCNGGSLNGVYQFGYKHDLVEFGCQIYEAKNPISFDCSPIQNCMNCHWGPDFSNICNKMIKHPTWRIKQYGRVFGGINMKKEIMARGPITCGMMSTNKFYSKYKSGIWSEYHLHINVDHAISVVGWGKENGEDYWIVRNSWGTQFGENGYFRITGKEHYSLGIGYTDCYWAVAEQHNK